MPAQAGTASMGNTSRPTDPARTAPPSPREASSRPAGFPLRPGGGECRGPGCGLAREGHGMTVLAGFMILCAVLAATSTELRRRAMHRVHVARWRRRHYG